jgi:hypothetical protein
MHATSEERGDIVKKYSDLYGITREHVYRVARGKGWKSGRKQRVDKGIGILAEEQLEFIAATLLKCGRENKGAFMPIENAMEFAIDNGIMQRGEVSLGTVQRQLRDREMSKRQLNAPTPHTDMRSLHPNHVDLVDVSTCIQYYLDDGGMKIMREDEFYKNKIINFKKVKVPLQRYILTDHFSGFMFVHYYLAAGETAENLFDFICRAWEAKAEQNFPFRGVPLAMLMDGGCRAKAKALGVGFWDALGIDIIPGTPGNSRRQGSVEVSHNIWEEWFETRLRIDPATNIEDLNRKSREFCIWFNANRKHSRTEMTRLSCWLMIKQEQLRELPERSLLKTLLNKPQEKRIVRNYRVSFQSKEFNLKSIPGMSSGAEVQIIKNLYKWQQGIVTVLYEGQRYEVYAIDKLPAEMGRFSANAAIIGQEYKSQPETNTQKAVKRLNELSTGTRTPGRDAIPFVGLNAFEGFADKVSNLVPLPKVGTPLSISRSITPTQVSLISLFKDLIHEGVRMTPELNQRLKAEFGNTIDRETAEGIKAQILETGTYSIGPDNCTLVELFSEGRG